MNLKNNKKVIKKILKNGLTVLVKPNYQIPKVSVQLWYNVGSKDENEGEKGLAHLIEHMIFKGTEKLSESDINLITHKLSGYCNAFTSYDYTGYLFDFPSHHWQESLPIISDCMQNCTFKADLLNSELKAVIQELKMYNDDYDSSLVEKLISSMFNEHPYQHPIIGYKHNLWNLDRENLIKFYKKHYIPNNATLVVVGDVEPEQVFELAQECFGSIEPNINYEKKEYHIKNDITSQSIILYRDVSQPTVILSYFVPGAKEKLDFAIDVLSWLLAQGRSSRLYKKLVNELELVIDVESFTFDLFDKGVFFISFTPKMTEDIDKIISVIQQEINLLNNEGPSEDELQRAIKKNEAAYLSLLEDNQKQAYTIGKTFLSTGDENFIYNYLSGNNSTLKENINKILTESFRPSLTNIGKLLPLEEKDKNLWIEIQKNSDIEDEEFLKKRKRQSIVEPGNMVHKIDIKVPKVFNFPKYETFTLSNGLEVLFYDNNNLPKIEISLELKAKHYYDNEELQGIGNFTSSLLIEGTNKYNAIQLANEIESLGMKFNAIPGHIGMSLLSQDFQKGLELLTDVLVNASFENNSIEKVRNQIISDIKEYWDDPANFATQLVRDQIYNDHHYKKNILGSINSVNRIKREDLISYYKQFFSPKGARIAIVGDLKNYNFKELLENTIGRWHGPDVEELNFKQLCHLSSKELNHYINRDQVVLCFAGLSISRKDPNFDKLLLFDQIFCGGVLGSMSSRLFQLREQSGLFYTISGSLIARADYQPGMSFIKTIVSIDRLKEAEDLIESSINSAANKISEEELTHAKNAISNSLIDNFASNRQIANSFLFLRKYNFDNSFFDKRNKEISKISTKDIQSSICDILNTNKMLKLRIGRVTTGC